MAVDTDLLRRLEDEHDLPSGLLTHVMTTESAGDPSAVSPKGAQGYFQFMPDTAIAYGVDDPSDFKQSATGAARYLSDLRTRYAGDMTKTLAAYNAGPTAVSKYNGIPPYKETQDYVTKIMGKLAEDGPPDVSDLAPDVSGLVPKVWGGEGNDRPVQKGTADYQRDMDQNAGSVEPIVGGIAGAMVGGVMGTAAGTAAGGAAGSVVPVAGTAAGAGAGAVVGGATGTVLGTGVGTFLGTMAGISRAESNGTLTNIPLEQKLLYAAKQSGIDMGVTVATIGAGKLLMMLKPFIKPEEMSEAERFFRKMGVDNPNPAMGAMADYAAPTYKAAAADMKNAVNTAVQDVVTGQAAVAGSPTKAGTMFQEALSKAHDNVSAHVDGLYSFARRGSTVGDTMIKPTSDLQDMATATIKEYKAQNAFGSLDQAVQQTLMDVSKGTSTSIADMISMKRGIAAATDFKNPEVVTRSLDQGTKTKLLDGLDASVSAGLTPFPKANIAYKTANKIWGDSMTDLRSTLMLQLVKKDPLSVTDYVARSATPTVIGDFENGLQRMVRTQAMTVAEAEQLRSGVRQNWITQNLGNTASAEKLADAISGKALDPALMETFNRVMSGAPQAQAAVSRAAQAAAAANKFAADIPTGQRAGVMGYSAGTAAGTLMASAVGVPPLVGSAVGAGLTKLMTSTIPKALAKAAMNNDTSLINKIRAATSWYAGMASAGRPITAVPAGVMEAIQAIEADNGGQQQ